MGLPGSRSQFVLLMSLSVTDVSAAVTQEYQQPLEAKLPPGSRGSLSSDVKHPHESDTDSMAEYGDDPAGQSLTQSVGQSLSSQSVSQSAVSQSARQSVSQLVSQFLSSQSVSQ